MVEEVVLEIDPRTDMCLPSEEAVAAITGVNVHTAVMAAEVLGTSLVHVNHLVTAFGGMASTLSEGAICA
jgi:hypothetical protein